MNLIREESKLMPLIAKTIAEQPVLDIHTHLFDPAQGELLLWNVDELLTYHYLIAETFRYITMDYAAFWQLSKRQQADIVWQTLFIDHTPCSESTLGVLTVLNRLGFDNSARDLSKIRAWFDGKTTKEYIDIAFRVSGCYQVIMTNDPFDPLEAPTWLKGFARDPRFRAALRIDPLLLWFEDRAVPVLTAQGYKVTGVSDETRMAEVRRFLKDWALRMDAAYMAVSLSDAVYPAGSLTDRIVRECVVPVCMDLNIPFALMIGVRRQINPELKLAGDGVGRCDLNTLESLCRDFPKAKFMSTILSRENQHELTVMTRKFRNLHIFGCWWFLNNPGFVEEMTRMRFELLGTSHTPQHSDARVLDQIIYKWAHSKRIITKVMQEKYALVLQNGWGVSEEEIKRDVAQLFGGEFEAFLARKL